MLSSPLKDGRRVLGEKTTNASVKTQHVKDIATTNSIKPTQDLSTSRISSSHPHAGQKRSIDQLDDAKDQSSSINTPARPRLVEGFQIFREDTQSITGSERENDSPTRQTINSEATPSAINTPKRHSTTTPTTDKQTETPPPSSKSSVPTEPAARQLFIQEKAGLLRSRLQHAVKTSKPSNNNHIDQRLSALEAHRRSRKTIPRPTGASASINIDLNTTPKAKAPRLLPAPDLRPTPQSARYNRANMPSSPPVSTGSAERVEKETDNEKTPVQSQQDQQPNTPQNAVQLSSPPGTTGTQDNAPTAPIDSVEYYKSISVEGVERMIAASKNVDRGEAANGLVKLMKTTREFDNLDELNG
ncbi:hypothetical protein FQN54_004737 [Arachnomyces sp. PD_36]|nr:hypothetical protein FQN54_004737 [Arachnomyces sp. PD_36]